MPGRGRVANGSEDSNQKLVTLGAHVVRARVASSNTRLPAMERGGAGARSSGAARQDPARDAY